MPERLKAPSLDRETLQALLGGLSEGVIFLDGKGRITWANPAALAMHRVEAIDDLGGDAKGYRRTFTLRYRNNHPLEEGQYPIERLLAGETVEDVTVEISPATDLDTAWVHTSRSMAISGRSDGDAVLALVIRDETPRFEAEERFERSFNANPAPGLICRLDDHRFIRVNQGFLEMTGFIKEDIIGRTVEAIGLFSNCESGEDALAKLVEGRVIRHREALVPLPAGGDRLVIVAGEPIAVVEEPCMLFTFADLDARRKAQNALRQSEERFSKSFRLSPAPAAISRLDDFVFTEANDAFLQISGYGLTDVVGRTAGELRLWDDIAARKDIEQKLRDNTFVRDEPMRMKQKDGAFAECLVSAERVEINDEQCVIWALQDVTERRRSEAQLVEAIESVMADTSWLSRSIVDRLATLKQTSSAAPTAQLIALSDREREILGLICSGQTDAEMSDTLHLSKNTIRNHIASLYGKIGVNRRAAAVIWARERGFTGLPDAKLSKRPGRQK
ncbi:LuxR family transcriptional regulator [Rhizobium sp. PP-F2F-G38]|uniref:Helix-turn-helix transcriptional regulator n=1 Tax=Ferranicluibacter rubi TaxID=2715133 RepID=A0AA44CA97_9HYPH|nr:helix-turn-helix transcriptional regulator [Ferranicluibacter rubi]NHT75648.1 helix-turn-helix transcriptional regulator [Ferranicluibacter rubi]PYE32673.1 LuxR family transcriptional regulator [Rhizobium sp. PP-WC-1G-195]PYE96102.1 LuxR family transcriptional regulator [Rhizobium sp. PP-F2F-G38]TCQ23042.1 LuxR family transcriptional regulator [Rhizobium sp. PP-CC-3G-465]